jgi:hypothetical protein
LRTVESQRVQLKTLGEAAMFAVPRGAHAAAMYVSIDGNTGNNWGNGVLAYQVSPDRVHWHTPVDWTGVPVGPASATYVDANLKHAARMIRVSDAHWLRACITTAGGADTVAKVTCVMSDKAPPRQPSHVERLSANVTTNSTSFSNVTGLWAYLTAGKRYNLTARVVFQASTTSEGVAFSFNGPTATQYATHEIIPTSDSAASYLGARAYDTIAPTTGTTPATGNFIALLTAYVQPSADGYMAVRMRAEAGLGSITVMAGSTLEVRAV